MPNSILTSNNCQKSSPGPKKSSRTLGEPDAGVVVVCDKDNKPAPAHLAGILVKLHVPETATRSDYGARGYVRVVGSLAGPSKPPTVTRT